MKLDLIKGALFALLTGTAAVTPEVVAADTTNSEAKVVYARAITEGDGYSAWSASDISKTETVGCWTGSFAVVDTTGLYYSWAKKNDGGKTGKSTMEFSHTDNTIQTVDFVWKAGGNPGSGAYTYVNIGDAITIRSEQYNQKGYVIINGVSHKIDSCNINDYGNRTNDVWTVKAVINTATKRLKSFSLKGSEGKAKASLELKDEWLGSNVSVFNKIEVGVAGKIGYASSFALQSIKISEKEQNGQTTNYTVNYKDGNTTLHTASYIGFVGDTINANSPLTVNGQRYYFADGATTTSMILAASGANTLDVAMRKAYEYNYSVVANNAGDTIATGKVTEGDTTTVAYPRFIVKNGKVYSCPANNSEYRVTFTPDADKYTKELAYTEDGSLTNPVFLSEGEDLEGAIRTTAGFLPERASNGAYAYAEKEVAITTLTPGKYELTIGLFAQKEGSCTLEFKYGSEEFSLKSTYGKATTQTKEMTINDATTLIWKKSGDKNNGLDYILIRRTAEIAPVTSAKFATYSPSSNISLSSNNTVKFYTAKVSGSSVVLTPVDDNTVVLKAGTGYVIAAEQGSYEFALSNEEATAIDGNDLLVAGTGGVTADDNSKYYVLTKRSSDSKVGFGKVKSGVTIPAGKCYIDLASTSAAVSNLAADFLEVTNVLTGIDAVDAETQSTAEEADVYYTLQGMKVAKPTQGGIYIVNGKKVVVK